MTKLAETYIHLSIDASEEFARESEDFLYSIARSIAYEIFEQDTQIHIRFEDGSWKTWIAVAGAIYIGIGQYGSFRSGIEYLSKDARKFSNTIIEQFIDREKVDESVIYRTERRLGMPGKLHRLFKKIDKLKEYDSLYPNDRRRYPWSDSPTDIERRRSSSLNEELHKIKMGIIQIFKELDNQQDKTLFVKSFRDIISDIYLPPLSKDFEETPILKINSDRWRTFGEYPVSESESISFKKEIGEPQFIGFGREEDKTERLKRIIGSAKFTLAIG